MPESVTFTLAGESLEPLRELVRRAVSEAVEGVSAQEDGFLDVDAAAEFLASTPTAVRSLVKRDAIPHHKAPNGRLLFERAELRSWVTSGSRRGA